MPIPHFAGKQSCTGPVVAVAVLTVFSEWQAGAGAPLRCSRSQLGVWILQTGLFWYHLFQANLLISCVPSKDFYPSWFFFYFIYFIYLFIFVWERGGVLIPVFLFPHCGIWTLPNSVLSSWAIMLSVASVLYHPFPSRVSLIVFDEYFDRVYGVSAFAVHTPAASVTCLCRLHWLQEVDTCKMTPYSFIHSNILDLSWKS